ncbi:methionine adenosyltransferase [Nostoc sp.]|uniref:methionine adenosyltransferase n=1 Tax=Nostoc sp. TaxID=1180 RepID=UPI002FF6E3FA
MFQNLTSEIVVDNGCIFPDENPFEIVERKGIGHPDTLADSLAELISIEYSKYTLHKFGAILHHHVDKLYVRGGKWDVYDGGADFRKPIKVMVNGRFSYKFGSHTIPIEEIVESTVINRLKKLFLFLKITQIQ